MSVFGKIRDSIFGKAEAATPEVTAEPAAPTAPAAPASTPAAAAPVTPVTPVTPAPPAAPKAPAAPVDVAAILDKAVAASGQKLNWKTSIVDMMKALGMDSSLAERKELATELKYTGDMSDSASMNIWLHKALMKALSKNGGKVPADLLD